MNREIKFRVWLPEDEIMLYSENDINGDFMEIWTFEGVEIQETRFREMGGEIHEVSDYVKPENQSLMQFTGLKDKNGKDIYEDDIINFQKSFTKYSVIWNNDSWLAISSDGDKYGCYTKKIYCNTQYSKENDMPIVIGNIHENKDLLS